MFRYDPLMANLSVNVYHFAGDKPDTVCKDEEQAKGVMEACNLYYDYAGKLHT